MIEFTRTLVNPLEELSDPNTLSPHTLSPQAEADLNDLKNLLDNPQNALEMKFLLLEQKYFEYLDEGRTIDALYSLRHEITTLGHNLNRVHELSR